MDCYGEKRRAELVNIFDIEPIAHVKLLDGQNKKSCTGHNLTDSYYCFSYKRKGTNDELKSFYCGVHASNDFLRLLNRQPLECFNPLKSIASPSGGSGGNGGNGGGSNTSTTKWNETAKELYNALNILIISWNIAPKGTILTLKSKIEKSKYKDPGIFLIKSVNTIISGDKKGKTMSKILEMLGQEHEIRNFKFENVNKCLKEADVKSYFE